MGRGLICGLAEVLSSRKLCLLLCRPSELVHPVGRTLHFCLAATRLHALLSDPSNFTWTPLAPLDLTYLMRWSRSGFGVSALFCRAKCVRGSDSEPCCCTRYGFDLLRELSSTVEICLYLGTWCITSIQGKGFEPLLELLYCQLDSFLIGVCPGLTLVGTSVYCGLLSRFNMSCFALALHSGI